MNPRALTAAQVAAEFGRSADWLYAHWQEMVDAKKLPAPLSTSGGLVWNAAQVYAVMDRHLTASQRASAAAFRAALTAAMASPGDIEADDEIGAARRRLATRFARSA